MDGANANALFVTGNDFRESVSMDINGIIRKMFAENEAGNDRGPSGLYASPRQLRQGHSMHLPGFSFFEKKGPGRSGRVLVFFMVAPPRIELGTRGFSVLCSTI